MTVKIVDKGWIEIKRRLKQLDGQSITVGLHSDSGVDGKGIRNVMKGFWTEYGHVNRDGTLTPERPALKLALLKNKLSLKRQTIKSIKGLYKGNSVHHTLSIIGVFFLLKTQKSVEDFNNPGNAESTIKQKGFDDPWIWTRELLNAIDYKLISR